MGIPAIISLAITALSVMLFASLLHVHRIKCLIAAVLGTLLSGVITSLLSTIGLGFVIDYLSYLSLVITVLCITLIAWLFSQHRVRSLLAVLLGVVLANLINGLLSPIINRIFG